MKIESIYCLIVTASISMYRHCIIIAKKPSIMRSHRSVWNRPLLLMKPIAAKYFSTVLKNLISLVSIARFYANCKQRFFLTSNCVKHQRKHRLNFVVLRFVSSYCSENVQTHLKFSRLCNIQCRAINEPNLEKQFTFEQRYTRWCAKKQLSNQYRIRNTGNSTKTNTCYACCALKHFYLDLNF